MTQNTEYFGIYCNSHIRCDITPTSGIVDFYIDDFIFALFIFMKDGKAFNNNGSEIIPLINLKYGKRTACQDNFLLWMRDFPEKQGKGQRRLISTCSTRKKKKPPIKQQSQFWSPHFNIFTWYKFCYILICRQHISILFTKSELAVTDFPTCKQGKSFRLTLELLLNQLALDPSQNRKKCTMATCRSSIVNSGRRLNN